MLCIKFDCIERLLFIVIVTNIRLTVTTRVFLEYSRFSELTTHPMYAIKSKTM